MQPELKHLFTPLMIKSMELKNRIVFPPITTLLGNPDGTVSDKYIDYYTARARGGAALITSETVEVHPYTHNFDLGDRGFTALYDDRFIPGLKRFTDGIHTAGAKASVQLHHSGRAMIMIDPSYPPLAPSAIPYPGGSMPRALTLDEIQEIVEAFGRAAYRAREAGFDAVDIHGGHGYLIAQFMSALSNRRTDRYGGDLLGRLRFPTEVLRSVRKNVGDDFPIIFRYSADERVPGGREVAESTMIAPLLVEAGADCLSITTSMHYALYYTVPAMGLPQGLNVEASAAIKKAVDVPVIAVGKLNDPIIAESVLADVKADLVAIGRGLIADPELPNKLREGRWEDVRCCISCNHGCIGGMIAGIPFTCMVNPQAGYERELEAKAASQSKRVVVAGSGPAGMEAACTAAERGHKVTLYEKDSEIGGQFRTASIPPWKQEISPYLSYMETRIRKLGVEVVLSQALTASIVTEGKPDVAVIATGARPLIPDIPGIDAANVVTASDVLKGHASTGQQVLVAGGGLIGCETAMYLDQLGKDVTIVEMLAELACDQIVVPREALLRELSNTRVTALTSAKMIEITTDGVVVERNGQRDAIQNIDTIVLAMGVTPVNDLTVDLQDTVREVHVIGDAGQPGRALDAIAAGARVGRDI